MSASARAWCLAGALCAAVVAADQAIKALVEANLETGEHIELLGPVELTLSHNPGVAFGLASGGGVALVALTVGALGLIGVLFARRLTRSGMWVAAGLLAGGAIGNLIDRAGSGEVTDYVEVLSWPTFNLADAAITIGVVLLALIYMRDE